MGAIAAITGGMALMQAGQTYSQANAVKSQGQYQSQIYDSNARMANLQAEDAINRGNKEANNVKRQTRVLIGSQRAAMAAQGIDLGVGSALDIQEETAALGAEDALTIKNNAWREAWGYKAQANDYSSKSQYTKLATKNEYQNTILTGGMNIAKDAATTYRYSKYGK